MDTDEARSRYVLGLRITVALSVGTALLIGVLRILLGWSLPLLIISGYVMVIGMTVVAPPEIVGIAYDSGGFGLIAFASLTPMVFVMAYGSIIKWI